MKQIEYKEKPKRWDYITYNEFLKGRYYGKNINGLLIDNVEICY
jgi:hypothetical protein